jgi:nucleoside-diphosphate-sugar epimerase
MDPALLPEYLPRNARIRVEGTRNLVTAAQRAGVRRLIAQSLALAYAPGAQPRREEDPLELDAVGVRGMTVAAVASLERQVLEAPGIAGVVLRYGLLYGPGTGAEAPRGPSAVHVDAAAWAALLAIEQGPPGIYNIAEEGSLTSAKAERLLGWRADFRMSER